MMLSDQISDDIIEQVKEYNWSYRFRICQNCPLEQQKKRNCYRVKDSYKIIKGVKLQQTHCKWLQNARANKFRDLMKKFFRVCMAETFGIEKAYPKKTPHSEDLS